MKSSCLVVVGAIAALLAASGCHGASGVLGQSHEYARRPHNNHRLHPQSILTEIASSFQHY